MFVRKGSDNYVNQKLFADFLVENGLNYDKPKLNVYYNRGKTPKLDLKLGGTPYYKKTSGEEFCEQEKNRLKIEKPYTS
ncbi:hypothetical protein F7731_22360 [Cytobacillus depressus]|uniref:Uncharacterized protein n=1 Tax=Cytobacillus depressus TaxID=1602942 RepID=A0A6L3V1F5_9BACI|nr:hypothetical protein [Cytobacillus depressus]KAB2329587.1 hypothetical protein F7731_22360 [Cytobacillus depressus]